MVFDVSPYDFEVTQSDFYEYTSSPLPGHVSVRIPLSMLKGYTPQGNVREDNLPDVHKFWKESNLLEKLQECDNEDHHEAVSDVAAYFTRENVVLNYQDRRQDSVVISIYEMRSDEPYVTNVEVKA